MNAVFFLPLVLAVDEVAVLGFDVALDADGSGMPTSPWWAA